ncbi:MAG: hypothetical protein Tsb0021_02730 [Chlamydiales bacterium]
MPKRLTVQGSDELEQNLQFALQELAGVISANVDPNLYRSILLIGGYGKGEGGVELINGRETTHNGLDILAISKKKPEKLDAQIRPLLKDVQKKYSTALDLSVVDEFKLKRSPCRLLWYDMFWGHRVLLGDTDFITSLPFSNAEKIVPQDFLELMFNRGTLLIINECILKENGASLSDSQKKIIIKHFMKVAIGYGDAILFTLGDYHWSYCEKLHRLELHPNISNEVKQLYLEASTFRFCPNYKDFLSRDLHAWLDSLKHMCADIYLNFERERLKCADLNWSNYHRLFSSSSLLDFSPFPSRLKRKWEGFTHPPRSSIVKGVFSKLGFWLLSPAERLIPIFPYLSLTVENDNFMKKIAEYLCAYDNSLPSLQLAFLKQWGRYYDKNLFESTKHWKLNLSQNFTQTF